MYRWSAILSFKTLFGGQFTLPTQLIIINWPQWKISLVRQENEWSIFNNIKVIPNLTEIWQPVRKPSMVLSFSNWEMCSSKVFLLRVSLAFISMYVKPSSSQTSVVDVVLPTSVEPDRRAALKDDPSWSLLKKEAVQNKNAYNCDSITNILTTCISDCRVK